MKIFLWEYGLKLILHWSSSCKCFTEQTLQVVSLFPATKNWLTNSYYLVPLRRDGSFIRVGNVEQYGVWTVSMPGLSTCLFCSSQSSYSFSFSFLPKTSTLVCCSSSLSIFLTFSHSLPSHRPEEFKDFCRKCWRQVPRQSIGTPDVSGSQQQTQPQKEGPGAVAVFLHAGVKREPEKKHSWPSVRSPETVKNLAEEGERGIWRWRAERILARHQR